MFGCSRGSFYRLKELSHKVKVSRIMVRQPQCLANSGAWTNGMPMTLGCGPWVSYPIPSTQPSDIELFGSIMDED